MNTATQQAFEILTHDSDRPDTAGQHEAEAAYDLAAYMLDRLDNDIWVDVDWREVAYHLHQAEQLPNWGQCAICGKSRPPGYHTTCGNSICQETNYRQSVRRRWYLRAMRQARRRGM